MRILYIAKHGQANNDDEGAIMWGMTQLGHTVHCLTYSPSLEEDKKELDKLGADEFDIALFHKLPIDYVYYVCEKWKGVCWFFDPIYKKFASNDEYVEAIEPYLYKGFFTDGDYTILKNDPRLIDLKQGFDSRRIGMSTERLAGPATLPRKILFIGTVGGEGYLERERMCNTLTDWFGPMAHFKYDIFKNHLKKVIERTQVMLAMPPVTDNYWSNRVYIFGGYGGFIMHPASKGLAEQFVPNEELVFYDDVDHLALLLNKALDNPAYCKKIAARINKVILEKHCYVHRCEKIVEICNE